MKINSEKKNIEFYQTFNVCLQVWFENFWKKIENWDFGNMNWKITLKNEKNKIKWNWWKSEILFRFPPLTNYIGLVKK